MLIVYETLIPLLASAAICVYLRGVLRNLLVDLCGTAARAEFWVRTSSVLVTLFPVLLAVAWGRSSVPAATVEAVLRSTLILTMAGIVLAVALMAFIIAASIPRVAK